MNRRELLVSTAAAVFSRVLRAADEADQPNMTVRSASPADLEMPLEGFQEWITPLERFFVRCHTYTPRVNLSDWSLKIDGAVDHPATLTMDELKQFPRVALVSVLECAGNGRSFYEPHMAGTQWTYGAVGNARWTGARLRDVLRKAGVKEPAKEILLDGADVPLAKMPDFQRTIPIQKALHEDTLLAYEMNGRPLTAEHGFPLRLIAPGWAGDSWVKWLQHMEVLDHEFDGFWMKTAYRHPRQPVAAGTAVDPKDMVPVTDLNVKSVIASLNQWAKPGNVLIQGAAWSNASPVNKVEVSTDGGKTWNSARLGSQQATYGWRLWRIDWKAAEGEHVLMARASNAAGETQPLSQEWNPSGYLWNVAQPYTIIISSQAPFLVKPTPAPAAPPQPDGYRAACIACHDEHMMQQQHLNRAQWDREINKMTGWGAEVQPQDREAILDYLSSRFKP